MLKPSRQTKPQPWDGFLAPHGNLQHIETRALKGKRVLVTGAGGYIGSALARALATLDLEILVLLDNAEHGLFLLDHDLEQDGSASSRRVIVGSICDSVLLNEVFAEHQPQIVFHAAAYKHVLLMEANPFAAVETNVLGTQTVMLAAQRFLAEEFILLSTDKAVDPISIMGATKRIAEMMVLADSGPANMKALRLCNVLGSSGSVAPLFCAQIAEDRPVTVTDREATRYLLSIEEAVAALIACASLDLPSGVYIPPTGSPYRIEDLAKYLVHSMKTNGPPSEILHSGLRVGDKLHESMTSRREQARGDETFLREVKGPTVFKEDLQRSLDDLAVGIQQRDITRLLRELKLVVPEYSMSAALVNRMQTAIEGRR